MKNKISMGVLLIASIQLILLNLFLGDASVSVRFPQESAAAMRSNRISEIDGMELVYVSDGSFLMGSDYRDGEANYNELPQHRVLLTSYWIDKTEVTNSMYVKFLNETGSDIAGFAFDRENTQFYLAEHGWVVAPGKENSPAVHITWFGAEKYCEWAGRRLPTEAEWEKAARGEAGWVYPWGEKEPDCLKAQYDDCGGSPLEVGALEGGASVYGAMDLAGNVWEWVADWYHDRYYLRAETVNPKGPDRYYYHAILNKPLPGAVIKGGSWAEDKSLLRAANRFYKPKDQSSVVLGFRCATSALSTD